jgi:hypothetical protein
MTAIDDRTVARMDFALEEACRAFPNGGDHETRKYFAEKLRLSALEGNITLEGLRVLANRLVEEWSNRKSA